MSEDLNPQVRRMRDALPSQHLVSEAVDLRPPEVPGYQPSDRVPHYRVMGEVIVQVRCSGTLPGGSQCRRNLSMPFAIADWMADGPTQFWTFFEEEGWEAPEYGPFSPAHFTVGRPLCPDCGAERRGAIR